MRITGGTLKNRRITIPKTGHNIRPTSDKMRLAIFNMLDHASWGMPLEGKVMLDGFCGSGIMGIEALSRGAKHAIFVDHDRAALNRLKWTLHDDLKIDADAYQCLAMDLSRMKQIAPQCDVVFLDPPYKQNLIPAALASLVEKQVLKSDALCVCEAEKNADLSILHKQFTMEDERLYGDSKCVILRYHAAVK